MSYYVCIFEHDHMNPDYIELGRLYPTSLFFTTGDALIRAPDRQGGFISQVAYMSVGVVLHSWELEI